MIEQFKTIKEPFEAKYKEKGSLFIGKAFPVESNNDVPGILDSLKKDFYDATHHCFAYKIIGANIKYSDGGEPNGTAGIRILNAIEHFELNNIIIVIIRYFGGTKLGVGPLGKAYYHSAYLTLENASIIVRKTYNQINFSADFSMLSNVHNIINEHKAIIEKTWYDDKCHFSCFVEINDALKIKQDLFDLLKGNVSINISEVIHFI